MIARRIVYAILPVDGTVKIVPGYHLSNFLNDSDRTVRPVQHEQLVWGCGFGGAGAGVVG
jgi:hypothetical protein